LHTRFASLVLGAALLEDLALWGVLAIATAMGRAGADASSLAGVLAQNIGATVLYLAAGLSVAPALLRRLHDARWNVVHAASPTGDAALVLLLYAAVAAACGVNLVFAAFLAGFGLVGGISGSQRARFAAPLDAIGKVGTGVF